MALIKKRDVKNYFAARRLQGSQLHIVPAIQAGAGSAKAKPVAASSAPRAFNLDFVADHTEAASKTSGKSSASSRPKLVADLGREPM